MLSVEEMTAWTNDDILVQIETLKPKGTFFRCVFNEEERFWHARFERFDEAQRKRVVLWEEFGPDERLTLFNAFGWIWARQQPLPPKDSPWSPHRRDLRQQAVRGRATTPGHSVPDPEDLDPEEVQAVYEGPTPPENRR